MDVPSFLRTRAGEAVVAAIEHAIARAEHTGQPVQVAHLADVLLQDASIAQRIGAPQQAAARAEMAQHLVSHRDRSGVPAGTLSFDLAALIDPALALARECGADVVSPLIMLATLLSSSDLKDPQLVRAQESLRRVGLTLERLLPSSGQAARQDFTFQSLGFGMDLTAMARAGVWATCPLVGLDRQLIRLTYLLGSGADSVVLVGDPGVGKSALIYGLAYHIAKRTRPLIPPQMDSFTVISLAPSDLLAGTAARGELEQRLQKVLTFFRKNRTVIPFFDEIHALLDTGDATARSIANTLKPAMATGQFRCAGATTDQEYTRFIADDQALSSRFTKLLIPEPDAKTASQIICSVLHNIVPEPVRRSGLEVSTAAVDQAIRLSTRYIRNERLPRKAINLLRSAATEKAYKQQTNPSGETALTAQDVSLTFSDTHGIPLDDLADDAATDARRLYERISASVRGQDDAVRAVTSWLSLHARGWTDSRRPRGRFLFLGPPGVGKTELAMALAEQVMRDRGSTVVKNMAEFKGEGARTRFMGADPGYAGFGETVTLYSRVMLRPFSVVVLDEIEKASAEIADPMLSVLDGYAEDSRGRWVDFSQCIFAMTSNALSHVSASKNPSEQALRAALVALGGIWQAPVVDRIDRIVMFNPLSEATLLQILSDMIARRRANATNPLPDSIDDPGERARIVRWALESSGQPSARGLERALLRWLAGAAETV